MLRSAAGERKAVCRQGVVTVEDFRGDLGFGGAADVEGEALVLRLSRGFGVHAHAFAEPHRDQGAVPEGEVGRERAYL